MMNNNNVTGQVQLAAEQKDVAMKEVAVKEVYVKPSVDVYDIEVENSFLNASGIGPSDFDSGENGW